MTQPTVKQRQLIAFIEEYSCAKFSGNSAQDACLYIKDNLESAILNKDMEDRVEALNTYYEGGY